MLNRKYKKYLMWFCLTILTWLLVNVLMKIVFILPSNASHPVDGILVLGGSIYREIHSAEWAIANPHLPILISTGSDDPCILFIFQGKQAPMDKVLLERCAGSTFGNYAYSLSILKSWNVHKLKVITSTSHLPRAQWLGQIILGSNGIWVEMDIAPTIGTPANQERWFKTIIDIVRSLIWALISQVWQPSCQETTPLVSVDIEEWETKGYACESQSLVEITCNMIRP